MSQPNEPRFEDDFDCDTEPPEQYQPWEFTIEDIAIEKGHGYANKVAPHSRVIYSEIKEAYKAGFLEGFSHRFTTNDKVSE